MFKSNTEVYVIPDDDMDQAGPCDGNCMKVNVNFFCTFDSQQIPISSAKADDNGTYLRKGTFKSPVHATFGSSCDVILNSQTCRKI